MNRTTHPRLSALIGLALALQAGAALAEDQRPTVISNESNRAAEDRMSGEAVREHPELGPEAQAAAERACAESEDPRGCERKAMNQLTSKPSVPTPDDGKAREDTSHGAGGY